MSSRSQVEGVELVGLVSTAAPAGFRAAACELVLEALVAERRLTRTDGGYRRPPAQEGPPQGNGYKGFDPFGT